MKSIRILLPVAIAALLSACGSNMDDGSTRSIVMGQSVSVPAAATVTAQPNQVAAAQGANPYGPPQAPVYGPNMPEPDCAADNCHAVRVIDETIEVAHLAAERRAAPEAGQPGV